MIIFNPALQKVTINPYTTVKNRAKDETVEDILKDCSQKLENIRGNLGKYIKLCKQNPDLKNIALRLERARLDLWPRGNIEDWPYNVSTFSNNDDKVISAERLWTCTKLMRKIPENTPFGNRTIKEETETLEITCQHLEDIIATARVAFEMYKSATKPSPIVHQLIDPDKDTKDQVVPGFVWKRFMARGKLPEYLGDADLKPLHIYKLTDVNGRLEFSVSQYYSYKHRRYMTNA